MALAEPGRFGSAADLVQLEDRLHLTPTAVLDRQFVSTGLLPGGIGAVAVGVSGVIAAVIGRIAGAAKVVDERPGQVLSAADCARWLAGDPGALSCHDAAVADWVDEVVGYRLVLGMSVSLPWWRCCCCADDGCPGVVG